MVHRLEYVRGRHLPHCQKGMALLDEKVGDWYAKGGGDITKNLDRYVLLSTRDASHIREVSTTASRKLFLRPLAFLAELPNSPAQETPDARLGHSGSIRGRNS